MHICGQEIVMFVEFVMNAPNSYMFMKYKLMELLYANV